MKKNILMILSAWLCFSSCSHTPWNPGWDLPPNNLYFQITKNGIPLSDSILNHTVLYYYDNGRYISDPTDIDTGKNRPVYDDTTLTSSPGRFTDGLDNAGVVASAYAVFIATRGFNTMYLRYPDGDIDTFFLTVDKISIKEGTKNRCYCTTPVKSVQFNGKDAAESTSLHAGDGQPVFVFEK